MPTTMRKISLLFFISFLFLQLKADPQVDLLNANTAYKNSQFAEAVSLYEKVIAAGYASSELYYNLGNAYYKSGQLPSSILYYERALKLDPSNEDIIYNLKVANNQIIDKIDELPALFYEKWWSTAITLFKPDTWAIITLVLFFIFFLMLAIFLLSRSIGIRRLLLPVAIVLLFITLGTFIIAHKTTDNAVNRKNAIVFAPVLNVKSSPEDNGTDLFVIHEGLKVEIIDELSGWREIKIANGSKGWIKSETIIPI